VAAEWERIVGVHSAEQQRMKIPNLEGGRKRSQPGSLDVRF